MKVTTLLLATYILLLTLQPMLSVFAIFKGNDAVQCCNNSVEKKEQSEKNNNKSEKQKQCNPSKICSCCVVYISHSQTLLFLLSKLKISTKQNFTYQSVFTSQFKPDFWQPPKIA